jgi:hypothetical protein
MAMQASPNFVRKVYRKLTQKQEREWEKRQLGLFYSPDFSSLDRSRHLLEAMEWLKRAQDAGFDRGVSYGVRFGQDFNLSYPETTGYICRTFVDQEQLTGDPELLQRAVDMGDWEIAIQLPEGAVMGGTVKPNPTPAVFNTGMVLLGWNALIRRTGEERFKQAAWRATNWLLSVQEADGNWIRGNSQFADPSATLYNVKAAWGLCETGTVLGEERFVQAAIKNAEFCISRQQSNGWFPDCCFSNRLRPLLHTIAYTMQGLVGIGKLTNNKDYLIAARKTADAELRIMGPDGFIPGRQDSKFRGAVEWCCLTGSAQTSSVWSELFLLTGEEKYRGAVRRVNRYLMARHDIQNANPRLRGGVPGSWPVWGDYQRLAVVNWATKFFIDALSLENQIESK